jgi:hypothetical protein
MKQSLYKKFTAIKNSTNEEVKEDVFVLIPSKDPAAIEALRTYARETNNLQLSEEITHWLNFIEGKGVDHS